MLFLKRNRRSESSDILDFSGAIFNNKDDISFISDCIEAHKLLGFKKINFSYCNLTVQDFESVCKCAGKLLNLESVILRGNNIPKTAGYIISKLLCTRGKLTDLVFTDNILGDVGVCAMAGAFSSSFSDLPLRIPLSTGLNGIGGVGSLLQSKLTLLSIDLSGNNIGDIGIITLCDGFKTLLTNCYNTQQKLPLKSLILNKNRITDKGATAIAELIDRGNLRNFTEHNSLSKNHENNSKYENFNENKYRSINSPKKITNNGTDWGFWVEKEDKISKNNSKNNSPSKKLNQNILNEKKENSNFLSSTLLLEILELGDNLLTNSGVSVILKAASSPLKNTEISNSTSIGHNMRNNMTNMKVDNDNNTINNKKKNNYDNNEMNNSNSAENGISDCISNIVFGTDYNPLEGVLLRKLNLKNSDLNLESFNYLNDFLSCYKIRKKILKNNDDVNHEYAIEIDFSFTEKCCGELINEIAKLYYIQSKNTENATGSILTEIIERFVLIVRSNKNITSVSFGHLIAILAENSVLLSDSKNNEIFNFENSININDNDNDENKNNLQLLLLSDINTTLELFNTTKDVVKISSDLSEFIEIDVTQKRKNNDKKKTNKNLISEVNNDKNNIKNKNKTKGDDNLTNNYNLRNNYDNYEDNDIDVIAVTSILQKMYEDNKTNNINDNQYDDIISKLNGMNKYPSTENNGNNFLDKNNTISVSNRKNTDFNKSPNSKSKISNKNNNKNNIDNDHDIHTINNSNQKRGRTKERENGENSDTLIGEINNNGFEKLEIDTDNYTENGTERGRDRGRERCRSREKVFNELEAKNKYYNLSPKSIDSKNTFQSSKSKNSKNSKNGNKNNNNNNDNYDSNKNSLLINSQSKELMNRKTEFEKIKNDHSVSFFILYVFFFFIIILNLFLLSICFIECLQICLLFTYMCMYVRLFYLD